MKVLMVGNDPSVKGGITSVITQLIAHDWLSDGIEMKFIPTYIESNPIKKVIFFLGSYIKIRKCLKNWKPDVVHIHMSYRGSFARKYLIHKLCHRHNIPDVIHLHGSEFEKWYLKLNVRKQKQVKRLLKECNALIVLGDKWNAAIKEIEPEAKTVVVSNTVAIPKTIAKWDDNPFKVLFLGVLIERKGVTDLLKSMRKLKDTGRINHIKFTIAGSGSEEEKLKKLRDELEVSDIAEFVGWIDGNKKKKLLETSQLLVLPSYNEGLPVAILEAISYGLPVVASDVGDISSAVHDSKNGYLITPGDVDALSEAIQKVAENMNIFESMSQYSRKLAEDRFSDNQYFETLRDCYKSV